MAAEALSPLARACKAELERASTICAPAGVVDFDDSESRCEFHQVDGKRVRVGLKKRPSEMSLDDYLSLKPANFSCKTTKISASRDHKVLVQHIVLEALASVKPFDKWRDQNNRFNQAATCRPEPVQTHPTPHCG